eukprot:4048621-Amphidinium_carterae.1
MDGVQVFGEALQLKRTFLHFQVPPDVQPVQRAHSEPPLDVRNGFLMDNSPSDRQALALPLCLYPAQFKFKRDPRAT